MQLTLSYYDVIRINSFKEIVPRISISFCISTWKADSFKLVIVKDHNLNLFRIPLSHINSTKARIYLLTLNIAFICLLIPQFITFLIKNISPWRYHIHPAYLHSLHERCQYFAWLSFECFIQMDYSFWIFVLSQHLYNTVHLCKLALRRIKLIDYLSSFSMLTMFFTFCVVICSQTCK